MQKLALDSSQLTDHSFTNDRQQAQLQTVVNDFVLYVNQAVNLMTTAMGTINKPGLQEECNGILQMGIKATYRIKKHINSEVSEIKRALYTSLLEYRRMFKISHQMFVQIIEVPESLEFGINMAKEAYDLAFFNMHFIHTELKFHADTNKQIGNKIGSCLQEIAHLLQHVDLNNTNVVEDAFFSVKQSCRVLETIKYNHEHWVYLHENHENMLNVTHLFIQNVDYIVNNLRNFMTKDNKSKVMEVVLEIVEKITYAIQDLTEVNENAEQHIQLLSKSILLETLAVVVALENKLNFLVLVQEPPAFNLHEEQSQVTL